MGTIIIAEAGVNHNGSLELAKKMVETAAEAGADYIKFQTFCPKELVAGSAQKADYQKKGTQAEESQLEMLEKLALQQKDFLELKECCRQHGIGFLSTPFDLESIEFLNTIDMDFWKLPSGEVTDLPYLEKIGQTGKPVIMSTGMCELEEVGAAVKCLRASGTPEITLLHCNTEYPTPMEDVNLNAMLTLNEAFHLPVGYSDHTLGIEVPVAATAIGASVIEKHFTLDRSMEGPDHAASLEPDELKAMVSSIRNIEIAMGIRRKNPTESEKKNINIVRKSIVAKCPIRKGEIFSEANLTTKRPGNGISPMRWHEVMGKCAERDFAEDDLIFVSNLSK